MKNSIKIDKQLQQFLQNSPIGLAVFDAAYQLLRVNLSFGEITAYPAQELNNLTIVDIIHPDDVDEMMNLSQQLFNSEISSFAKEQRWVRKNGEIIWVNLTVSAISDESNSFSYGVAMVEDISQHKNLQDTYQNLIRKMGQTEELATIGRLTSTLTHEINNSMHVVQGLLNLSLEELDNPVELMSYLNMSLTESTKVVELIGRLRYSYHSQPEPASTFELNDLLGEIATLAHRELKRKNVAVSTRLTANALSITSRLSQLYLIFLSLTLNLGEILGSAGKGEIAIRSNILPQAAEVTLFGSSSEVWPEAAELDLSLSFGRDKIVELGGDLLVNRQNGGIACVVEIPFSIPETPPAI